MQALQAHNQVDIDKLRLFQQLGVPQPAGVHFEDNFAVAPPAFSLDSVIDLARRENPQVNALRAREHAAGVGVHRAHGLYTPTLQLSTGIGGYTYQYTNQNFLVESAQARSAAQLRVLSDARHDRPAAGLPVLRELRTGRRSRRRRSPRSGPAISSSRSHSQNIPRQITATLRRSRSSTAFQREQQVEQAEVDRDNARYNERARELAADRRRDERLPHVLTTSVRTVDIQEQNAAAARQALSLAEERYRVGAATFVDVTDARAAYERAENDRIWAVYDYHKAFAALESAVGRPLR